jgi:hypothetical protein
VTFELVEDLSSEEEMDYYATSGSVQWDHSGTYCFGRHVGDNYVVDEICTGQAAGSVAIGQPFNDAGFAWGVLDVFLDTESATYSGVGILPRGGINPIVYTCRSLDGSGDRTFEYYSSASIWFTTPDRHSPFPANLSVGANGTTIEGSFTNTPTPPGWPTSEWSWHFDAVPLPPD